MGLFGNSNYNNNNNDSTNEDRSYKALIKLVDDKSVFGRHYKEICEMLQMRKVPAARMPSKDHFMSRIFACLDEEKLSEWITNYVQLESTEDGEESDDLISQEK